MIEPALPVATINPRLVSLQGFGAVMEPGVSAEACLYADLGLDPGTVGCAHNDASQLPFYRRVIDTSAWLVLWQVGLAGDRSYAVRARSVEQRQRLVDRLLRDYPADHPVTIDEAATLHMHRTLAVPQARALEPEPGFAPAAEKRASIAPIGQPTDAHASP